MKTIVKFLTESKQTIATMESCTGGAVVNAITDIEGASEILKFSAITYANEFKVKMGVAEKTIEDYTVYSNETAMAMSKSISTFANADYGIGITGKLNRSDKNNLFGDDNLVYISVYNKENNDFTTNKIKATFNTRKENKRLIVKTVVDMLQEILHRN